MKAVFIVYGQSLTHPIEQVLDKVGIRGFTRWEETHGRGSYEGEPHYGTHAWPSKNGSVLTMVEDHQVEELMDELRHVNDQTDQQGLNAYVWHIENKM